MTDITELTAKLKAAALKAKAATEDYAAGRISITTCYSECAEFNSLTDGPDQILPLIEALEAAQSRIASLEARTLTVKLPTSIEPLDFAPWTAKAFWALHRDAVQRCRDSFKESCAAAGIKLQIEGE